MRLLFGCEERLVLGSANAFWEKDISLTVRILLHSRVQISQLEAVSLPRYAVCWLETNWPSRMTYGGDFHSAKQRLNPGNCSLREIPIKETVAPPSEQFYLTTEFSNVVGTTNFGHEHSRRPCWRRSCIFVSNFSVHRLRFLQSDPQLIRNGSVSRPFSFTAALETLLYIAPSPIP